LIIAMTTPKYCSWDVKELASDYGWAELPTHPNDEGRMISFYSDRHGGVRANVYMKTGTVATSLDHPTQGKTQLFRGQRNTFEQLEEIFQNPRVHTDFGYKTRSKLREEGEDDEKTYLVDNAPDNLGVNDEMSETADLYEGLDDLELLRIEDEDASEYSDRDEIADLFSKRRSELDSFSEFDGESLMEKLMNKWDEDEEAESDEMYDKALIRFSDEESVLESSEVTSIGEGSEEESFNEDESETDVSRDGEGEVGDHDGGDGEVYGEGYGGESSESEDGDDYDETEGLDTESDYDLYGNSDDCDDGEYDNDSDDY